TVGSRDAAVDDSLAEYQDFLERYVNFRLKVLAAEAAGVPQSPKVSDEIRTYRANLARPYLLENEVIEPVVRQLYMRQKQLNDVSHVLIRMEETASAEDTLAAYQRASALRDSVLNGMDFGDVAFKYSEDPSAQGPETRLGHRGRLGYFSAGRMIEPFETTAYETPVGGISAVFRTQFGYHFLYVHDRRDAVADVQLSHIMIRPTLADSAAAFDTLRVVQRRLESQEDFAELAREYSQDAQSSARGGDIGFISYDAPIHGSFKDPAFALEEVGDVTGILETPYGLHIVKLTGRKSPQTFEESYEELKTLASRLPRMKEAEREFARDVIAERNSRVDTAFVMSAFESMPADSVFAVLIGKRLPEATLGRRVFVIGDTMYSLHDISEFAANATIQRRGDTRDRVMNILTEFVTERTIENEAERLEDRDPEF
ncbi:MAG: peptidylprolyl isomerase, partial [Rhodothermales bacterium]